MHTYNNALQVPFDVQDGDLAHSPLLQANNNPRAIKSLIAIKKLGYRLAMSASRDELEASIDPFTFAEKNDVARRSLHHEQMKESLAGN